MDEFRQYLEEKNQWLSLWLEAYGDMNPSPEFLRRLEAFRQYGEDLDRRARDRWPRYFRPDGTLDFVRVAGPEVARLLARQEDLLRRIHVAHEAWVEELRRKREELVEQLAEMRKRREMNRKFTPEDGEDSPVLDRRV